MVKDNHLGGFVRGGDERCHYPDMWKALVKEFNIKSVVDVGCGEGQALEYFKSIGVEGLGIDGSEKVLENAVFGPIKIHDFTKAPYILDREFDLGWSCEFVEHVEEEYMENFMSVFDKCRMVAMSHALPGQGGYHHVNEKDDAYWIEKMESRGFEYMPVSTRTFRLLAHDYFQRSGLIFVKTE